MDGEEKAAYLKKTKNDMVSKVMEDDADNLETHFVENPFIKIRERASAKKRFGATALGEEALLTEQDLQDGMNINDVYYMKESGKMIVKDFEKEEKAREERRKKRATQGYGVDSDTDSDDEGATSGLMKKGASARQIKNAMREHRAESLMKRSTQNSAIGKTKSNVQIARNTFKKGGNSGHIEKFSGDAYRSNKGKGDVIKAGQHEPFSYI